MLTTKAVAALSAIAMAASLSAPAFASANVNETVNQINIANHTGGSGLNLANVQDNAFQYASGNIGLNVASGNSNMQGNISYIDAGSPTFVFSGTFNQITANEDGGSLFSGLNSAHVRDSAFANAEGNINVNVASGDQNSQLNGMMVAENTTQVTHGDITQVTFDTNGSVSGLNLADIRDNAFDYAKGNIGLNVAAGNLNQQANEAVIQLQGTEDDDLYGATFSITQFSAANLNILSGANTAKVRDNAFSHATGNIGVNLASGNGNQQANALIVTP
jgi:trimeric autotransporter adhesin